MLRALHTLPLSYEYICISYIMRAVCNLYAQYMRDLVETVRFDFKVCSLGIMYHVHSGICLISPTLGWFCSQAQTGLSHMAKLIDALSLWRVWQHLIGAQRGARREKYWNWTMLYYMRSCSIKSVKGTVLLFYSLQPGFTLPGCRWPLHVGTQLCALIAA